MGAYARWRALRREQQLLTAKSAAVTAVAATSLRLLGVARTLRMAARPLRPVRLATLAQGRPVRLATLAQGRPVQGGTTTVIGDVVSAVDRAGRYVPGATCLSKSLAIAWMLRGQGVAATIRVAVRTAGGFEAHAWVECEGVALTDAWIASERFAVLVSGQQ